VVEGAHAAGLGQRDVDDLLPLAMSRPHEALARAREILAARPHPYAASVAHQAAGIVLRDVGDVEAGVRELRAALRLTRRMAAALATACLIGVLATWLGVLLAYDSYYWGSSHLGLPVSFFIVAVIFVSYLVSGLAAGQAARVRAARQPVLMPAAEREDIAA